VPGALACSGRAIPEIMPAQPGARSKDDKHDGDAAERFQIRPLRGNVAKRLPTKE
jgi:hypothetical protein